jgi:hypothetical protein
MNDARERKIRPAGGSSVLKGSSGEGADGWAPCGGRAGEREGERWARQWRTAGSARRGTGWLTGGPGIIIFLYIFYLLQFLYYRTEMKS